MNKKLAVIMTTVMMLGVTGCGNNQRISQAVESPVAENTQNESTEAGTVTIVHDLGETEVTKNPKKVVVLDYGVLDSMQALNLEVVGVPTSSTLPEYLSSYADESIYTNVGSIKEVDLEAIHTLEPDLIISGTRLSDYYESLSEIAPTILLNVDNSDYMNSLTKVMTSLGEIFDKQEEVEEKIAALTAQVGAINEKTSEMKVNGLIVLANGDTFSVYGRGSRFGIIHDGFGIAPVDESIEVSTHGQNASFEYIVEQNPDYLFVVDRTVATGGEGSAATMFDNELIRSTDAYKNGRIVYLNPTVWYTAGGGLTSTQIMLEEISKALEA